MKKEERKHTDNDDVDGLPVVQNYINDLCCTPSIAVPKVQ